MALLVLALGLAGGFGLRRLLVGGTEPAWGARLTVSMTTARMTPTGPVADLDVDLLTSDPTVEIVAARATGRAIVTADRPVSLTPDPQAGTSAGDRTPLQVRRRLTVPLNCTADQPAAAEPAGLTLALRSGSGARHEVSTIVPSNSSTLDDLCSQAVSVLPLGWQHPVTAASFTVDPARPDTALLTVSGLPTGFRGIATTTVPPLTAGADSTDPGAGTATLRLQASSAPCEDYLGPTPVGVSMSVSDANENVTDHYVAVGLPLVRWLLDRHLDSCRPDAPVPTAPTLSRVAR